MHPQIDFETVTKSRPKATCRLPDTEDTFERRLSRKAKRRLLFFARNIDILVHHRRLTRFFMMVVGGRGLLRITSWRAVTCCDYPRASTDRLLSPVFHCNSSRVPPTVYAWVAVIGIRAASGSSGIHNYIEGNKFRNIWWDEKPGPSVKCYVYSQFRIIHLRIEKIPDRRRQILHNLLRSHEKRCVHKWRQIFESTASLPRPIEWVLASIRSEIVWPLLKSTPLPHILNHGFKTITTALHVAMSDVTINSLLPNYNAKCGDNNVSTMPTQKAKRRSMSWWKRGRSEIKPEKRRLNVQAKFGSVKTHGWLFIVVLCIIVSKAERCKWRVEKNKGWVYFDVVMSFTDQGLRPR